MKKIYGLQNDKEIISLIIADDKPLLIIQTAESFKVRELKLQYDNEDLEEISAGVISADKVKLMGFSCNCDGGNESEVYKENGMIGVKMEALESNIVQSIAELSKKLTDLDDKINLKVDTKEFWDFIDYFLEKQQTKVKLNLGSKDYQSIVDTFKQRDEDSVRELNLEFDNEDTEIAKDGAKISSANKENQPKPIQRALKRIKELEYITDVRIDEEFETTIDDFPKNRLTITIDYLDVDFVKEARKADGYKLN